MNMLLTIFLSFVSWQKFNYWKVKFVEAWNPQPLALKIVWSLSALFITLFLLFFIVLIIKRFSKNIKEVRSKKVEESYQKALSVLLFNDEFIPENIPSKKEEIVRLFGKKNLRRKFSRRILLNEIVSLNDSYSGETKERLIMLFNLFNLNNLVAGKLRSPRWSSRAEGINIAARLNLVKFKNQISLNVNNPNPIIRGEAFVASIRFNNQDPLSFFENLKFDITKWEQIQMHAALKMYNTNQIPEMKKWTTHNIDGVVVFALRMIGFYNQEAAVNDVLITLGHKSIKVKLQAIRTLGELRTKLSLVVLLSDLDQYIKNNTVLVELLKALLLIRIRDQDLNRFDQVLSLRDHETTLLTISVLLTAPKGKEYVDSIAPNLSEMQQSIISQVIFSKSEFK